MKDFFENISSNARPSGEQLKAWEEKYGKLTKVRVADKEGATDEALYFYFRRPTLAVLRLAQKDLIKNRDTLGYAGIIIKNTVVNGLELIERDEEILLALLPLADEFTTSKVAEIEKN